MAKIRIDQYLVQNEYLEDIEEVKRYVMAGKVFVNEQKIASSAKEYKEEDIKHIRIKYKKNRYVSRAGLKLEKALEFWNIDLKGKTMLDVGSSTGGFVDCALKKGVDLVYALDVGTNQLEYSIRVNPKVKVFEQTNFRLIKEDFFDVKFDIITMDVSFISIKVLLENVYNNLKQNGLFICLIKPQFEASRYAPRNNGVIEDESIQKQVIQDIKKEALKKGLVIKDVIPAPIRGTKGNQEFLALIYKGDVC